MGLSLLRDLAQKIGNKELKDTVVSILEKPSLSFVEAKPLIRLEESPAAPRKHHFFTGGLIVHTYSVTKVALALANIIREVYGIEVDEDLVIATAILHDIYKYYQYAVDEVNGGYRARDDWYLGHDYAILAELAKRGASEKLIRAVSEVHGQVPFSTVEGLLVHLADSVDARLGEILQNLLISKVREYEKTCAVYKAMNSLIAKSGIKSVLRLALSDVASFRKIFEEACKEQS